MRILFWLKQKERKSHRDRLVSSDGAAHAERPNTARANIKHRSFKSGWFKNKRLLIKVYQRLIQDILNTILSKFDVTRRHILEPHINDYD